MTRAWGAAFVLVVFILLANIGARVLLARSRGKMTDEQPWDRGERPSTGPGSVPGRVRIRTESRLAAVPRRESTAAGPKGLSAAIFDIRDMSVYYGSKRALTGTTFRIHRNLVTAVIGPSGCGKSTFIRSLNRMNDAIPGFRLTGQVLYHGHDIYGARRQPG